MYSRLVRGSNFRNFWFFFSILMFGKVLMIMRKVIYVLGIGDSLGEKFMNFVLI